MNSSFKILFIDDEPSVRKLLKFVLESEGYSAIEANSGEQGLMLIASHRPDVIILDLGLPDISGRDVLMRLREWSDAPVIILTANKEDDEKVLLLDAGADDYLVKPFHTPELLARIRVALRHARKSADDQVPVIAIGELEIDLNAHLVKVKGEEVKLTATEFNFLALLAKNHGKIVTQSQILKEVWGPGNSQNTHYLRVYAAQLRKKIEAPLGIKLISTEPGIGYRMLSNL